MGGEGLHLETFCPKGLRVREEIFAGHVRKRRGWFQPGHHLACKQPRLDQEKTKSNHLNCRRATEGRSTWASPS